MSILQISYSELSKASKQANKSAKQLESYSSSLSTGIARKINSISGGVSGLTQNALDITNQKINKLNEKATKLYGFSKKIDVFKEKVKETDDSVAKTINIQSDIFARNNDVRKGVLYTIFQGILTELLDLSQLKLWVKFTYYEAKNKFNDFKTDIKRWWRTGGGKYILDIAGSVLILAGAVFTIFTAGCWFIVGIAIVSLVIKIADLITNLVNTKNAMKYSKYSPSMAHKYGKTDTLSDTLKLNGNELEGKIVATVDIGAEIILAGSALLSGIKGLLLKSKAIKNFFGHQKYGLKKKFLVKVHNKTKIRIIDGLKSTFTDKKFMHNLCNVFKSNLKKDKKKFIRFIKGRKDSFKALGFWKTGKKILINTKNQIISKYNEIDNFDGTSKVFKFKLSKNTTKVLKVLNKVKFGTDIINDIKDLKDLKEFKFKYKFTENINFEDIYDITRGVMKISNEFNPRTAN